MVVAKQLFFITIIMVCVFGEKDRPNIVFIVADDLGWNDVSYHGSDQIQTPNIDSLAYSGVALSRYYSHAVCTPSRSALLTGKYAHKLGMQGYPLTMSEDRSIPLSIKLLPQYLKDAGYSTHLVGKWHVGASRNEFLPTFRGFDTHFGHRGGYIDYYEYNIAETVGDETKEETGFALFRNLTAAWDVEGYITDVYTKEAKLIIANHDTSKPLFLLLTHNAPHSGNTGALLQAPRDTVRRMRHVESADRRIYAAMVKKLDDSIGDIVEALNDKRILDNTIIAFVSDNGGATSGLGLNYASNYPMRGIKFSPFEGGVRVVGLLWSKNLNNTSHNWNGYFHVADWLPTLLKAVDIDIPKNIDGISHWDNINSDLPSTRTVMYEIDDYAGYASITERDHKLITGVVSESYSTYQGEFLRGIIGNPPSYSEAIKGCKVYRLLNSLGLEFDLNDVIRKRDFIVKCEERPTSVCQPYNGTGCLYNIMEDPCETTDLSETHPDIVRNLQRLLQAEADTRIPRTVPLYRDPLSAPRLFNYTWAPWIE